MPEIVFSDDEFYTEMFADVKCKRDKRHSSISFFSDSETNSRDESSNILQEKIKDGMTLDELNKAEADLNE